MSTIANETLLEEDMLGQKYLIFRLGEDSYGIKIKYVTEIIGMQHITAFPEVPAYVKGIINLRGSIIPVVDLQKKLKNTEGNHNDRTCIIISEMESISIGFIVDGVEEVETILPEGITKPPDYKNMAQNRYIEGISQREGTVKILLDSTKILKDDELEELKDVE